MTLQTITDGNNATVAFLQQQDFPNAVLSSTALLRELHRMKPQTFGSSNGTACESNCLDQSMLLSDVNTSKAGPCHDTITPFVYEHGILIPSTGTTTFDVVSTILIFNTALAHQLYAQEQQQEKATSQKHLLKSKRLYQLALDAHISGDEDVNSDNVLFQFAVMNNIAVIELQTGNATLSTQYFEYLMSILMLLVDRDCRTRLRHLHGFLRNVAFPVQTASAA